jgi:hypothetical protein
VLWELRERYKEATQGPTPEVAPHSYGIEDERFELLPLFQRRMQKLIASAKESKELDLVQNGLTEMPAQV